MHLYDESLDDQKIEERKIYSATTEKDEIKDIRKQRTTSESPVEGRITKRTYEDSYAKKYSASPLKPNEIKNHKSQNSYIRLGPLDSIKEVVSRKASLANPRTNSNLFAAHKASASNLNTINISPYGNQPKTNTVPDVSPMNSNLQNSGLNQNKQITPTNALNTSHGFNNSPNKLIQTPSYSPGLKNNSSSSNLNSNRNYSPQVNRPLNRSMINPTTTTNNNTNTNNGNNNFNNIQNNNSQYSNTNSTNTNTTNNNSTNTTNRTGITNNTITQNNSYLSGSSAINNRPNFAAGLQIQEIKKRYTYIPPPSSNKLKYYIGGGNNAELVEKIMSRRDWWEKTEGFNTLFNFKWQQTQRGYRYERLVANSGCKQVVNHFENHKEISTKNLLIKNLSLYCELNKAYLFDMTPTTFLFDMDDEVNFDTDMQRFAKFFIKHHPEQNKYPRPNPSDKKNHNVWYDFDYRKKKTYAAPILNNGKKPSPYLKPKINKTFIKGKNVWILKPTGFNRGIGIEVFNSLEDLNEFLNIFLDGTTSTTNKPTNKNEKDKEKEKEKKPNNAESGDEDEDEDEKKKSKFPGQPVKSHTFVIQKYIESLLVVKNRKFDIRVWSLVTHEMQLYFFKEGYLRMSSCEFNLDDIGDKFIHLTNNAVQKYSENYGQFENGNQLSFSDFERYCAENDLSHIDVRGKVIPRVKELIQISMESVKRNLNPHDSKYCFEIFGYDFMIDSEGSVWLIEVNTNPCIEESSPILQKLIPRMLDDGFKLTIDTIFPPPKKPTNTTVTNNNNNAKIIQLVGNNKQVSAENENENIAKQPAKQSENEEKEHAKSPEKKDHDKEDSDSTVSSKDLDEDAVKSMQPFKVDGYSENENMWEFLCSLKLEKSSPKKPVKQTSTIK